MSAAAQSDQRRNGFLAHYLGPLSEWLEDPAVSEISVNPDGRIWLERVGQSAMISAGARLSATEASRLARQIAGEAGHRLSDAHPMAGCKLAIGDGAALRVQVVAPPIVEAPVLSIRRIVLQRVSLADLAARGALERGSEAPQTADDDLDDLLERGEVEAFLRSAVAARKNVLVSGGTSSGKTTFLRALLSEADPTDRIVTIEDARELHPTQANTVSMLANRRQDAEGVSDATALLEATLRMRPDRIILGELRGIEAYAFLEAINTGHPGSLATIHADDPASAFDRLALMVLRANRGLTRGEVVDYARSIIDVVVQLGRDADGARRVRAIETKRMR